MTFVSSLILLVYLIKTVELIIQHRTPPETCDFNATILPTQLYSFANENWPATYDMGIKCRWTFNCIEGYACRLRCPDVGLPDTLGCYMDKLLVSVSNDAMLGARVFCGRDVINLRSLGTKLTLKLITSKVSPGGRFRCTVTTEKWKKYSYYATVVPFGIKLNRYRQDKMASSTDDTTLSNNDTTELSGNTITTQIQFTSVTHGTPS